jgi:hypothetical protein
MVRKREKDRKESSERKVVEKRGEKMGKMEKQRARK